MITLIAGGVMFLGNLVIAPVYLYKSRGFLKISLLVVKLSKNPTAEQLKRSVSILRFFIGGLRQRVSISHSSI